MQSSCGGECKDRDCERAITQASLRRARAAVRVSQNARRSDRIPNAKVASEHRSTQTRDQRRDGWRRARGDCKVVETASSREGEVLSLERRTRQARRARRRSQYGRKGVFRGSGDRSRARDTGRERRSIFRLGENPVASEIRGGFIG